MRSGEEREKFTQSSLSFATAPMLWLKGGEPAGSLKERVRGGAQAANDAAGHHGQEPHALAITLKATLEHIVVEARARHWTSKVHECSPRLRRRIQ